ncbi:MAG: DNA-processing protein DprA, partial [Stackebrandtia sp.]
MTDRTEPDAPSAEPPIVPAPAPDVATDTDRAALITLATLCEPGSAALAELLHTYGPSDTLERLCRDPNMSPLHRTVANRLAGGNLTARLDAIKRATDACGARVITSTDPQWPEAVNDLAVPIDDSDSDTRAPICLWLRGDLDPAVVATRSVSIVGSRSCSSYGRHVATGLGYDLAGAGWTVVSGGAHGIDAAAHHGALAADGVTVAVLACGVDRPYPVSNGQMFDHIARTGLLLSEWPPGAVPQRHRFLTRNRVIAAISPGTVVVEAALRSGARQTARRAWELDRQLLLVPGAVNSHMSAGVHQLARGPGPTRIVTRAAEIIEDLGELGTDLAPPLRTDDSARDRLDPLSSRLLDALPRRAAATVEHIAMQAGLSVVDVRRTLPSLVARGWVDDVDD